MSSSSQSLLPGPRASEYGLQQAFSRVSQSQVTQERNTSHESPWLPPGTLKGWPAVASDTSTNLVALFGFLSESSEICADKENRAVHCRTF